MQAASIIEAQHSQLSEAVLAARSGVSAVAEIATRVLTALRQGRKLLSAGNGGSAADALHLAEELTGRYKVDRQALPALSLVADPTALTCIGNDYGFESIFSRQIEALGQPGDVLVVFSTSGNSPNLIRAMEAARARGMITLALLGRDGGKMAPLADASWIVPSLHTARIQELHTWALHCILEIVEADYIGK